MTTALLDPAYSIGAVAVHTGLSQYTLRWYERIGLLAEVRRDPAGQRRYTDRDLALLDLVKHLRTTGMPVAEMVRYAQLARSGAATAPERRSLLEAHREHVRERIAELAGCLDVLDRKIDYYRGAAPAPREA